MDRDPRRRADRLLLCLQVALGLAVAAAVAAVPYLPTHDGPQHVFTVHAATHLDAPGTGWSHWLEPNLPVTSHGFTAIFAPFDLWLPWPVALRIALAIAVLLWAAGAFALARAVHPGRAWLGLALGAAACQWSLYMGFFSFHVASGFGLAVLAVAFAAPAWTRRIRVQLGALLFVQALLHVVAAAQSGLLVAALAWFRARPGRRVRALAGAALLGAPAMGVAIWLGRAGFSALGDYHEGPDSKDPFELAPWWSLAECFVSGPAWRAWPLTLLALAALGVALPRRTRPGRPEDRALLAVGAVSLAAAALLPLHVRAWDFFSVRFLPLGTAACVLALPWERLRSPALRRAGAAALCVWAFVATGWAYAHHRALHAAAAPALAGLDAPVVRHGMRLPIVLDPYLGRPLDNAAAAVPFAVPLLNLGQLYAASQGGLVPYTFMFNPELHPVLLRREILAKTPAAVDRRYAIDLAMARSRGDAALRRAVLAFVAGRATDYEDVIAWGRPEDVDQLLSLGFEAEFRRGGLALARFVGCPLRVHFPKDTAPAEGADLAIGWYPAWHATHRYPLGRARPAPDGGLELRVRQSCGAIWLGFEAAGLACDGADAEGRLLIASTRESPEVECRARRVDLAAR